MEKSLKEHFYLPDSEAFFMKILDVSEKLSDADALAIAENFLQTSAPLPIESLVWAISRRSSQMLIYATSVENLRSKNKLKQNIDFIMPIEAVLFTSNLVDGNYVCRYKNSLTFLTIAQAKVKNITSKTIDEEVNLDDNLIADIAKNMGFAKSTYKVLEFSFKASNLIFNQNFALQTQDLTFKHSWKISSRKLRKLSDIRSFADLQKLKEQALKKLAMSSFFVGTLLLFLILSIWQISLFIQSLKVEKLEESLAMILPRSTQIETMSEELAFLKSFSGTKLYNVYMIAQINKHRKGEISFTYTSTNNVKKLQVQGKADSIKNLNDYITNLRADEAIETVEATIPASKAGITQFKLNITFK